MSIAEISIFVLNKKYDDLNLFFHKLWRKLTGEGQRKQAPDEVGQKFGSNSHLTMEHFS